jgi:hypothetical protein
VVGWTWEMVVVLILMLIAKVVPKSLGRTPPGIEAG